MTRPPLVSAIVIFLEAERFLREAVESVLAQTYARVELILVDDGSTDGGTAIAQGYAQAGRARCLTHPGRENRGMSASRNLGLAYARGELVAFLDADDVWLPEKLERQVELLQQMPDVGLIYGSTEWWYSWTGDPADAERDVVLDIGVPSDTVVEPPDLLLGIVDQTASPPATCSALVRRDVVDAVGGFEDDFRGLYEDQAFLAKVLLRERVFTAGMCLDRYRQHARSACSIALAAGELRPYGTDEPRHRFLEWLDAYVAREHPGDARLRASLAQALLPFRAAPAPLEILDLELSRNDAATLRGFIDYPRAGDVVSGHELKIHGWALGDGSPVALLEVASEGRRLDAAQTGRPRPDLVRAFPGAPGAGTAGFELAVPMAVLDAGALDVVATLENGSRKRLATLHMLRRWRTRDIEAGAPLVSLVVVALGDDDPGPLLDAILVQTYARCEVVLVVDDLDGAAVRAAGRVTNVRLVLVDGRSRDQACRAGLAAATGQLVGFPAPGDEPGPSMLAESVAALRDHPAAAWAVGATARTGNSVLGRALFQRLALLDPELRLDESLFVRLAGVNPLRRPGGGRGARAQALQALVLTYHRVGEVTHDPWGLAVTPARFARHLDLLREQHAELVPLSTLAEAMRTGSPGGRLVAVTFDDGYAETLEHALPVLDAQGVPASFFLVGKPLRMARELWWDELEHLLLGSGELPARLELELCGSLLRWRLDEDAVYTPRQAAADATWRAWEPPPTARHQAYVDLCALLFEQREDERAEALASLRDWAGSPSGRQPSHRPVGVEDVRRLAGSPLAEIGSHTLTHTRLASLPPEERMHELAEGRRLIGELAGSSPAGLAYPGHAIDDVDEETAALAAEAGFEYACLGHGGVVLPGTSPFLIPRATVHDWDADVFSAQLSSWLELRSA